MQLWLAMFMCLCVGTYGHPVSDSTSDTFVVASTEGLSTELETATSEQTEESTDGPTPQIKLLEMEVTSMVTLRYAHTSVMARVKNPAKISQEANFRVLLPETAFISGFVMILDDKSYKAYVKGKEEAKQIYDAAVSQGFGAAHVQAKARDSNQFVVSVNVEPSSTAVFNLTYEELLIRRDGVYHHSLNLHPEALVPKLSVTVHIKETQKITELRVPEIRTGNEIDATKDDAQNTKATIDRTNDDKEAIIKFTPDIDEQLRLMEIYADKSKESASHHKHWHSRTGYEDDDNKTQGVLGQFVVQYDVERPKDGEILVNDGYFVHFFAPSDLAALPKYVVFVLDTSGSMLGRKIAQLREAMQTILSNLNPGDFFHIVEFSTSVAVHDVKEADREAPGRQFLYRHKEDNILRVPPAPATAENIAKAKTIVSRLEASASTNIIAALKTAVDLIHTRTDWSKKNDTTSASTQATTAGGTSRDTDLYDYERLQSLEPIIIFLTDGQPNVGVSDPTAIVNQITEKITTSEEKITIFSLAFGNHADHKFLRKLSLRNNGFMRHIYEAADAALQLQDFYRRVSSPLLADVHFIYPDTQVQENSVTKNSFRNYYAGSELVVAGKMAEEASEVTAQVISFCKLVNSFIKVRCETNLRAPVPAKKQEYFPLERLWSYLTIKQLLDKKDASDDKDNNEDKEDSPKKKALALALKYEFVTPLTSLVVVKPNATSAVNAESVDKPNNNRFQIARRVVAKPRLASYPSPNIEARLDALSSDYSAHHSYPSTRYLSASASLLPSSASSSHEAFSMPSSRTYFGGSPMMHSSSSSSGSALNHWAAPQYGISGLYPRSGLSGSYNPTHSWGGFGESHKYPTSTRASHTSTSTLAPSPLQAYHLQEYSWTRSLLNTTADALVITIHHDTFVYKLTRDHQAPHPSGSESSCAAAVGGGDGRCVYLTRCVAAKNISIMTYATTHCSADGFAGVCCSQKDIIATS